MEKRLLALRIYYLHFPFVPGLFLVVVSIFQGVSQIIFHYSHFLMFFSLIIFYLLIIIKSKGEDFYAIIFHHLKAVLFLCLLLFLSLSNLIFISFIFFLQISKIGCLQICALLKRLGHELGEIIFWWENLIFYGGSWSDLVFQGL